MTDWRDDPNWKLASWDETYWSEPPTKPTAEAELAQPPVWASVYAPGTPARTVATWYRAVAVQPPPKVSS